MVWKREVRRVLEVEWGPVRTERGAGSAPGPSSSCGHCWIVPGGSRAFSLDLIQLLAFHLIFLTFHWSSIGHSAQQPVRLWGCQPNLWLYPALEHTLWFSHGLILLRAQWDTACQWRQWVAAISTRKGNSHSVPCFLVLTSQRKSYCVPKSLLPAEKIIFKDLLFQMWSLEQQQQHRPESLFEILIPGSTPDPLPQSIWA